MAAYAEVRETTGLAYLQRQDDTPCFTDLGAMNHVHKLELLLTLLV